MKPLQQVHSQHSGYQNLPLTLVLRAETATAGEDEMTCFAVQVGSSRSHSSLIWSGCPGANGAYFHLVVYAGATMPKAFTSAVVTALRAPEFTLWTRNCSYCAAFLGDTGRIPRSIRGQIMGLGSLRHKNTTARLVDASNRGATVLKPSRQSQHRLSGYQNLLAAFEYWSHFVGHLHFEHMFR